MRRIRFVMLALLAILAGIAAWRQDFDVDAADPRAPAAAPATPHDAGDVPPAGRIAFAELPPESRETFGRIVAGGPFPFERDGVEFRNFEGRLPHRARGWYHEYTVPTPGVGHRGARRIVTGGTPPRDWYYTDDHYESFREIAAP